MVKLAELFGNRNRMKVMQLFLDKPKKDVLQKDVHKKVRISKGTSLKCLHFLAKYGVLKIKNVGRYRIYRLNTDNTVVKQLKILNNIMAMSDLKNIGKKYGVEVYLYGSCARGDDVEDSDIDILIIGKAKRDIIDEVRRISKKAGREVRPKIFLPVEWSDMARKDRAFYERVEKDKLRLF